MIELISAHIPKTGGTSFGAILERLYGDRLYRPDDSLPWDEMARRAPPRARAVHGHLMPREFLTVHPAAAVSVWCRHPIDWAVSYYRFWLETPPHGNAHHDALLHERLSLIEFVERRLMEPTPREYLEGVPHACLGFIGSTSHFDADVRRFLRWVDKRADPGGLAVRPSELLGVEIPWLNRTRTRPALLPREVDALRELLSEELVFYEALMRLRSERLR